MRDRKGNRGKEEEDRDEDEEDMCCYNGDDTVS